MRIETAAFGWPTSGDSKSRDMIWPTLRAVDFVRYNIRYVNLGEVGFMGFIICIVTNTEAVMI